MDNTRKRFRLDSDANSDESKRCRVDSDELIDSAEARLLQEDLLNILDESDSVLGLDSVIRSFEEEIMSPEHVTPDSGESQPQLGYLLEASDDELGLPPTVSEAGERELRAADFENGVVLEGEHGGAFFFEDEIPSYDSFEYGIGAELSFPDGDSGSDYVALGGLFDGWDGTHENDVVSWRTESLPAL